MGKGDLMGSEGNSPEVVALVEALQVIYDKKNGSLIEVKSMKDPPNKVKRVFIVFGNFFKLNGKVDHDWETCLYFLHHRVAMIDYLKTFSFEKASR